MKRTLFYPCSGRDIFESVRSWMHIIDDFWFAEMSFSGWREFKSAEDMTEIPWRIPNVRVPGNLVSENETTLTGENDRIVPVRSATYHLKQFNKSITLNFAGGCAVNAFHALPVDRIAVFVNRGDHRVSGEGSSGICWLSDEGTTYFPEGMLQQVLSRMDVGGFIVTDGSNAVEALAPYWRQREFPADVHLSIAPVTLHGVQLRCVGMLRPKYGPTLVWQNVG